MTNPFRKLGIGPDSSTAAIKRAYRTLAKQTHPDMRPDKEAAAIEFRELSRIYEAALAAVGKVQPKPKSKPKPPPPPKPVQPVIIVAYIAKFDSYEFDHFGEAERTVIAKPELFEYGGVVKIVSRYVDYFMFEVPPNTPSGQRFRFKYSLGIVEIQLVKGR